MLKLIWENLVPKRTRDALGIAWNYAAPRASWFLVGWLAHLLARGLYGGLQ